eukprot:379085_1
MELLSEHVDVNAVPHVLGAYFPINLVNAHLVNENDLGDAVLSIHNLADNVDIPLAVQHNHDINLNELIMRPPSDMKTPYDDRQNNNENDRNIELLALNLEKRAILLQKIEEKKSRLKK